MKNKERLRLLTLYPALKEKAKEYPHPPDFLFDIYKLKNKKLSWRDLDYNKYILLCPKCGLDKFTYADLFRKECLSTLVKCANNHNFKIGDLSLKKWIKKQK